MAIRPVEGILIEKIDDIFRDGIFITNVTKQLQEQNIVKRVGPIKQVIWELLLNKKYVAMKNVIVKN